MAVNWFREIFKSFLAEENPKFPVGDREGFTVGILQESNILISNPKRRLHILYAKLNKLTSCYTYNPPELISPRFANEL